MLSPVLEASFHDHILIETSLSISNLGAGEVVNLLPGKWEKKTRKGSEASNLSYLKLCVMCAHAIHSNDIVKPALVQPLDSGHAPETNSWSSCHLRQGGKGPVKDGDQDPKCGTFCTEAVVRWGSPDSEAERQQSGHSVSNLNLCGLYYPLSQGSYPSTSLGHCHVHTGHTMPSSPASTKTPTYAKHRDASKKLNKKKVK